MYRLCNWDDDFVGSADGTTRCGRGFDDVRRSTICPHHSVDGGDPEGLTPAAGYPLTRPTEEATP